MPKPLMIAAAITLCLPVAANADVPGRGWMSSAKVSRTLAKQGYRVIKIEADDGHWEGEATRGGRKYDFHVDPHSGRVTKMERDRD
ncbi:conserved exported hypothetical protein [Sphingomonas sp. EC-HK361]|uniref:PepSY domain-containing protein n=1 Tax=Sphingomonas sp. EC-HK361 TaxID=2038397 RepID=UPI001255D427|nr:PepSY domain-containing protein [Sphingomonas sp. EC-HK361]VVT25160.1 conserved exported hypothetical protein [Sphingomonas sp. EC-HK361]